MTTDRHLERDLPAILGEIAMGRYPDYIDDVLVTTAQRRQRPAWTFPERWLPVELVTSRVGTTRMPWRQIGVLALIALLLATAIVGYVASQQTRLPAPFGPARNGHVVFADNGDIYSVDPRTSVALAIVSGPETDLDPRFSRDGTKAVFERRLDDGKSLVFVVEANGGGLTQVTPEPLVLTKSVLGEHWDRFQFSPDGQTVVIASSEHGVPGITIAQSDGSGIREVAVPPLAATEPSFRPDGSEILFVADGLPGKSHGIFAVNATSGTVRTIVEPSSEFDLAIANWSPNGAQIAYTRWGGPAEGLTVHTRIISADGKGDRELPAPHDALWSSGSEWSNDGTRLLMWRGYTPTFDEDVRVAVVPADGSSPGTEIPYAGIINAGCCAAWEWAPDDSKILGTPIDSNGEPLQQVIVDPVARVIATAPWTTTSDPTWQRLAP
jgi:Tol biopolymer transport system component